MKLISLNIWGGQVHKPLLEFIKKNNNDIDIFCFQEVFKSKENVISNGSKVNIYYDIVKILKEYSVYYAPTFEGRDLEGKVDFEVYFGQAIFVKKNIKIIEEESVFIFGSYNDDKETFSEGFGKYIDFPRVMQYVILEKNNERTLIANIHGYWNPKTKNDTPQSLMQSERIIEFLDSQKYRKILCGDFNLNPNTQSMTMLEKEMINLIKKYNIKSTRSKHHDREDKFADYILVSKDIEIRNFEVLPKHISDHLPLFLEFS